MTCYVYHDGEGCVCLNTTADGVGEMMVVVRSGIEGTSAAVA